MMDGVSNLQQCCVLFSFCPPWYWPCLPSSPLVFPFTCLGSSGTLQGFPQQGFPQQGFPQSSGAPQSTPSLATFCPYTSTIGKLCRREWRLLVDNLDQILSKRSTIKHDFRVGMMKEVLAANQFLHTPSSLPQGVLCNAIRHLRPSWHCMKKVEISRESIRERFTPFFVTRVTMGGEGVGVQVARRVTQ